MRRKDWTVTKSSTRPVQEIKDRCFYCDELIGNQHKEDCVIRKRTIKVKMEVEICLKIPEYMTEEDIDYRFNKGIWCADNIINNLENVNTCLCHHTNFTYLGEADEQDERDWNIFVEKEES